MAHMQFAGWIRRRDYDAKCLLRGTKMKLSSHHFVIPPCISIFVVAAAAGGGKSCASLMNLHRHCRRS
jgi:hypothetical protein